MVNVRPQLTPSKGGSRTLIQLPSGKALSIIHNPVEREVILDKINTNKSVVSVKSNPKPLSIIKNIFKKK